MKINDELTVKIEKLSNLGFGIARVDGFVIFVENACKGDTLRVRLTKVNKNFANAEIVEILEAASCRVKPFCALQKVCGACQLQFIDYEHQLKFKKEITQDALHGLDIEVKDVIPSPQTTEYRHKIQYPISQTKNSKRILAGYYKPKTHEIVNIKHCPIQPKPCDEIIEYIRQNAFDFAIEGYNEKKHSGDLRHVVLRCSASNSKILVALVVNATKPFKKLRDFAKNIFENNKNVVGVCANYNSKQTNVILGKNTEILEGVGFVEEKILDKKFKISANTFFQVNPKQAENIFSYIKSALKPSSDVLDAYAGISAIGICVSDICRKVVTIEENSEAVEAAKDVANLNKIKNIEFNSGDASAFLEREKRNFDAVILDPPRKGCDEKTLLNALRLTKDKIIYVSCNPSTLARDLKFLTENGAKIESVQPFDMFCHSYHIENVAIIKKTIDI